MSPTKTKNKFEQRRSLMTNLVFCMCMYMDETDLGLSFED